MTSTVLKLAQDLMACPSVTPAAGLVCDCLEGQLKPLGFGDRLFCGFVKPVGQHLAIHRVLQQLVGNAFARGFALGG